MPPNSLCEWMVGQNCIDRRPPRPANPPPVASARTKPQPRRVFSIELETDDESASDMIKLTYPRTGQTRRHKTKKVRFAEDVRETEVKNQNAQVISDSDTDVSTIGSTDEATTGEEPDSDCSCTNCVTAKRKSKKTRRVSTKTKKEDNQSSADDSEDSTPVVCTKHKRKKAKVVVAPKPKAGNSNQKAKPQAKKCNKESESEVEKSDLSTDATQSETEPESEAETTGAETSEAEATEAEASKAETTEAETTDAETGGESEAQTTDAETEAEPESEKEAPKNKGMEGNGGQNKQPEAPKQGVQNKQGNQNNNAKQSGQSKQEVKQNNQGQKDKQGNQGNQGKQDTQKKQEEQQNSPTQEDDEVQEIPKEEWSKFKKSSTFKAALSIVKGGKAAKQPKEKEEKEKEKPKAKPHPPHNPPPKTRPANILLPRRSRVLSVEHAVEIPQDPQPNAFYDNVNGVMRVYHGPIYGNPYGELYPQRVYGGQSLPVGTPHPMQNPVYNGFPPASGGGPMPSHGRPQPPQQPQKPEPFQPASPIHPGQPRENPWLQGYGRVKVGDPPGMPPFETNFDEKEYDEFVKQTGTPTPAPAKPVGSKLKNSDRGGQSNVIPSIEVPKGQKEQEAKRMPRDTQSAHGSRRASGSIHGSQDGGNNGSHKGSDNPSAVGSSLQEAMAKDKASAKARLARWGVGGGSKESSPAFQSYLNDDGNNNNDQPEFGGGQTETQATGFGGNNGGWGGGRDAPNRFHPGDGNNSSRGTPEWSGVNSTNNVYGGRANNNGNDNGNKKSKNGSRHGSLRRDSLSRPSPPGGWVSVPGSPTSTHSRPRHTSPGNVGGNWAGSKKGKSPSPPANAQENINPWEAQHNQDQNQGGGNTSTWQDSGVAQSSGGIFDREDAGYSGGLGAYDDDKTEW
ncbi:hypothetical protein M434DRAFT_388184 [Hypoxylon sp. CO27-5]|nr:hypothetical protein M434DRAFT_388184 [Hypoxylon sp. CO27-5]